MSHEGQQWSIAQRLPADILCELYETSADLEPFRGYTSGSNYAFESMLIPSGSIEPDSGLGDLGWIRLSHVCSLWRSVGIGLCTKLWARLNILAMPCESLGTILERAGDLPLIASTEGAWQTQRTAQHDLELVLECIYRLRELHVVDDFDEGPSWLDQLCPAIFDYKDKGIVYERLETLVCQLRYSYTLRGIEDRLLNAPNLRRLTIDNPFMPFCAPRLTYLLVDWAYWDSQYPDSMTEGYRNALGTFLQIFQTTTELEELELRLPVVKSDIMDRVDHSTPSPLPNLRRLRLTGHVTHCIDCLSVIAISPRMSVDIDTSLRPDRVDSSVYTSLFKCILPGLRHGDHGVFIIQPTRGPPLSDPFIPLGPHIEFGLIRAANALDAGRGVLVSISPCGDVGRHALPLQRREVATAFFSTVPIAPHTLDVSRCDWWQDLAPTLPNGVFDHVDSVTIDLVYCGFLRYAVSTRSPSLLPVLREVVLVNSVHSPSREQWETGWASLNEVLKRYQRAGRPIAVRRIKSERHNPDAVRKYHEIDREGLKRARELAFEVVDEWDAEDADGD